MALGTSGARDHWDATYSRTAPDLLSWHQPQPAASLELIASLALAPSAAVVDVGGGASTLVDHLLALGFLDITVLDVSPVALTLARERVGAPEGVTWLETDVLSWQPARDYDLWHDRAVFHFLVDARDQQRYVSVLRAALSGGGCAVIATFARDGPERCSGLPVARYATTELIDVLGGGFAVVGTRREVHTTPAGIRQPFTWVAVRAAG